MVGCGQTSARWLFWMMPLPPLTRANGSRERRSSAFIREDSVAVCSFAYTSALHASDMQKIGTCFVGLARFLESRCMIEVGSARDFLLADSDLLFHVQPNPPGRIPDCTQCGW